MLLLTSAIFGQAPSSFKYQAVLRDARGNVKAKITTNIGISILKGSASGSVAYSETHNTITDGNGLLNLEIGRGKSTFSTFENIDWGTGNYFIKVTVDNIEMGTSQLLSVPYALFSLKSGNGFDGKYSSLTGAPKLATVSTSGNYSDLINIPEIFDRKWKNILEKPTTIAGYGITDAVTITGDQTIAGIKTFTGTINANNRSIRNVATPQTSTDAVNKAYVDKGKKRNIISGDNIAKIFTIPDSTDVLVTYDGYWNSTYILPVPSATNNYLYDRIGTFLLIKCKSSFSFNIDKLNTDLPQNINLTYGQSSLFVFDGDRWLKVLVANNIPIVSTNQITSITTSTAISGGNVTQDGGSPNLTRGVCWDTKENPTIDLSTKTIDSKGFGGFTSTITGLKASTTYYVRAYATNAVGVAYGNQVSFTLSQILSLASLTTLTPSDFTSTSAILGGNVTSDGNATVTEKGVCYDTIPSPTTSNSKVIAGVGTGSFNVAINNLSANTTYYARAYAINSQGTAYGNEVSFKTNVAGSISMLRTDLISPINLNQWHYIAITKASNLVGKLYIDGKLISTGTWENQQYVYNELHLGASFFTSWGNFFKGYLDEFRMSKVVRTDNEILNYYNSNREFATDVNTIGLWHFNESSGTTFSNSLSGTNSGNLYNGVQFASGKFGNCLYFNGINSRGNCNLDIPEYGITFEFWFKFSELQSSAIMSAYGMNNSHILLNK